MRPSIFPLWVFVAVALAIALSAFVTAQLLPGAGVIVAGLGATLWVAYVARRGAIERGRHG